MTTATASYQTRSWLYTGTGAVNQRIIEANPTRLFLKITGPTALAISGPIYPGPPIDEDLSAMASNLPQEWKWKDCPSIVAGEFYGSLGPGSQVLITECLYVGN